MVLLAIVIAPRVVFAGGIRIGDAQLTYRSQDHLVELCARLTYYEFSNQETPYMFVVFAATWSQRGTHPTTDYYVFNPVRPGSACIGFQIPQQEGLLELAYFEQPDFSAEAVARERAVLSAGAPSDYQAFVSRLISYHRQPNPLGKIKLKPDELLKISTYIQLNSQTPEKDIKLPAGTSKVPMKVSWVSTNVPPDVTMYYRYRLYPTQLDWSNWSEHRDMTLTYVPIGIYIFEVQVEARAKNRTVTLPTARWDFALEATFIGPSGAKGSTAAMVQIATKAYTGKRALLVGVTGYQHWDPLPFVSNDVARFRDVLVKKGFANQDVTVVSGRRTKIEIETAIGMFLKQAKDGEQLIVYLSGHGFGDTSSETGRAYFAGADCDRSNDKTCVDLSGVENDMVDAIGRDGSAPRHILLVVDACASGRAIVAKGDFTYETALMNERAVHVVTAGTRDQVALPDGGHQMSKFTRFLVDGLDGAGDTNKDGVIELSELMVWVRWQVSLASNNLQTPSFARIKGAGEMMFLP